MLRKVRVKKKKIKPFSSSRASSVNKRRERLGLLSRISTRHAASSKRAGIRKYRALFEHLPDPYFVLDLEKSIITDCNQAMASMLKMLPEEIIGLSQFDLSPEFQEHVGKTSLEYGTELFAQLMAQGAIRFEWMHKRADGEHFMCDVHVSLAQFEGKKFLLSSWRDISIQKNNEKKLQNLFEDLESSKLGSNDAYWRWNPITGENYIDKHIYRLLEYDENSFDTSTESMNYLLHPDDRQVNLEAIDRVLKGADDYDIEVRLKTSKDRYKWFHSRGKGFRNEKGELLHLSGSITDIDYRKQLELNLIKEKEKAIEAEKAKSFFLANMSHEIRTPMNGILGLASLLLDKPIDQDTRDKIHLLYTSGTNLLNLLSDIIDFSKIESGQLELEKTPFNLKDTINNLTQLLSQGASEKGVIAVPSLSPEVPIWIQGDPNKFRQVLTNLVGNAIKHTASGEVNVAVTAKEQQNNSFLIQVDVKDRGKGIPEDIKEKIFDSFAKINSFELKRAGDIALGLSVCKGIIHHMGGKIWLENNPDIGSTFSFTFLAEKAEPQLEPEIVVQDQKSANEHYLSILVVEDIYVNKIVICGFLERLGYLADVASNGEEAVSMAMTKGYDVIFMDCHMPVMDGFEATRSIQSQCQNSPKIIALSAGAMKEDQEKCFASGMDDFIAKPVSLNKIREALKDITPKKAATKQEGPARSLALVSTGQSGVSDRTQVLLLEDDHHDARFYMERCLNSPQYLVKHYMRLRDACTDTDSFDVILNDLNVLDSVGIATFDGLKARFPKTPIIILAGDANLKDSEIAMERGAYNYIQKDHIDPRLLRTEINFAIERSSVAARLSAARTEAERQSAYKSTFLAHFSHEIRTPLNAIIGMSSLLRDTRLDVTQKELLEGLRIGSNRLLSIINDILDISKIESGKMELEYTSLNLRQLVHECLILYSPESDEKGVLLSDYFDSAVPSLITSDANRIRQVLSNYISNALKYAPQGSIQVLVSVDGDKIRIGVKDTGAGLSQEKCDKLFSPFMQASIKDTTKGTGLGLVVCKKLAILMGGDAGVHSIPGDGSEFWFTFAPKKMQEVHSKREEIDGMCAILISQDKYLSDMLISQLENRNIKCIIQKKLEKELLSYQDHDVIFIDNRYSESFACGDKIDKSLDKKIVYITREKCLDCHLALKSPFSHFKTLNAIARINGEEQDVNDKIVEPDYDLTSFTKSRILVVDDDALNRKVLNKILEKYGFRADNAENGEDAINKITNAPPYDIIFMDCMMPVKDGYETSMELRKSGNRSHIIALTANAFQKDKEKCLSSGMDFFLAKPINQEDIKKILGDVARLRIVV